MWQWESAMRSAKIGLGDSMKRSVSMRDEEVVYMAYRGVSKQMILLHKYWMIQVLLIKLEALNDLQAVCKFIRIQTLTFWQNFIENMHTTRCYLKKWTDMYVFILIRFPYLIQIW